MSRVNKDLYIVLSPQERRLVANCMSRLSVEGMRMPKLFVAVVLPDVAAAELVALRPHPVAGVRPAQPDQMHLTLHYVGEAEVERTAAALGAVTAASFPLILEGVGRFSSADGAVILWAGVRETPELLGLHAAAAAALAEVGFRPEARRYAPHITLARCGPETPPGWVEDFLAYQKGPSATAVAVAAFGLYSSAFVNAAPVYRLERLFPLRAYADGSVIA
jgi:2'-5' RNA ligase